MKLRTFTALMLALVFIFSLCAEASYTPVYTGLTDQIATRSGPHTDYNELGAFFSGNDWKNVTVRAYSMAYNNNIWWVQIGFEYRGTSYRAYTSAKRLTTDTSYLPVEQQIGSAYITYDIKGLTGPGNEYKPTTYTVRNGLLVDVYDIENGYVQIDYLDKTTLFRHRCWVPENVVNWNGARPSSYVTPSPTPYYSYTTPTPYYNYTTPTPYVQPTQPSWNGNDWSYTGFTGEVNFRENDTFVRSEDDTYLVVTSNVDLNGIAMIELTLLDQITYHNLYLYMDSYNQGSFMTLDGKEGVIYFYDSYAVLRMDLSFAGLDNELMLYKTSASE
ncbi:MAG: hypothetical protein II920_00405 [Clostridia bacterium]|nr:hypothetical protein [Clostridia bacterium]